MIHFDTLFKISYGIYIVTSGDRTRGNGYVSNTFFQVTADPPQFAACSHKDNFTTRMIVDSECFAVSVLKQDPSAELIGTFGYKSGRDLNKMAGVEVKYGETGVPVVLSDAIAWLECRVVRTIDLGTHLMFIGELLHAEIVDDVPEPLTYAWYRRVRKGLSPKNAPTYIDKSKQEPPKPAAGTKKFKCVICGYVHDESEETAAFADLPADWVCPICGAGKEEFIEIT